jgi:hypothetical protein
MATFLVSRTRLAGVDAWEAERVAQVSVEAARRRDEHRGAARAALVRMRDRGETISVIAALAETTESEVRGLPKLASATRRVVPAAWREEAGGWWYAEDGDHHDDHDDR